MHIVPLRFTIPSSAGFFMTSIRAAIFLFAGITLILASCSPLRKLGEDQYLLTKNKVGINKKALKEEVYSIVKQKPNRKILGLFRFHLTVYQLASGKKESGFRAWIRKTIGEEPVILDTSLTAKSAEQISRFMHSKGYFNSEVTDTTVYRNKKARVFYRIASRDGYILNKISIEITDTNIKRIVESDLRNSLLKSGNTYDEDAMQKERDRITKLLKNNGYYFFNQQYIKFEVDTNLEGNNVNLYLLSENPSQLSGDDSAGAQHHRTWYINNVYVRTDYDPLRIDSTQTPDTSVVDNFHFLALTQKQMYKPSILIQHIFLKKGELFSLRNLESTYRRLGDLGVFKFVNVKFQAVDTTAGVNSGVLNCFINLTPSLKQSYNFEIEGTHNGGNIGLGGNIIYRNKNTFRSAELLEIKLQGSVESQKNFADTTLEDEQKILFFNTYEIGPEVNLIFQKFLLPFKVKQSKLSSPKTTLTGIYNYQFRPEFQRSYLNFSYGYNWKETVYKRHFIYPLEINTIKVKLDPNFEEKLNSIGNLFLRSSYQDHIITNSRWTFIWNTQELNKLKNFHFLRTNLELAGFWLWLRDELINSGENKRYEIFNVPYAQYVKPDLDFRFYQVFDKHRSLVFRLSGGIGFALQNKILPFEKSFFAGGSNDLRAWRARTLGPGAYKDEINFEQTGDIKINGNIEYRFDIIKILQSALFVDAGNIWLRKPDASRPGGAFEATDFISEIAIGGGVGLRLNFDYFIIRVDGAVPFRDPSLPENDRWIYDKVTAADVNYNFGIGYPF